MDGRELIERARTQTGLEDFGGEGFRDGFDRLIGALDAEAQLHDLGRQVATHLVVRLLVNRLRVTDWLHRHPEIEQQEVPAPIFVLGLPRTGTTALSGLLACDPDTRSVRTWESSDPVPPPEASTQDSDPRIARAEAGLAAMHEMFPEMRSMHDATATGPTECQDLLGLEFKAPHFAGQYHIPSFDLWVRSCDMVPAYRTHRRVLQLLQWRCPPTRWHLKTPVHMLALPALLEVYPDARFVMTHRDPARVLGSVCSLIRLMYRVASDWDDPKTLGREQVDLWATALERAVAFRDTLPSERFVDVPFAEQLADPIAAVERAYEGLALPFTPQARERMAGWAAAHRRGRHGEHRYRLADFGLDAAEVRDRFRFYLDRFDVPEEEAE
jgi:hypothetical protein